MPGHRLVEQQEARPRHQRPGELEQLALAARERPGVGIGQLGQVEDLEQLHRLLAHLALAAPPARGRKTTFRRRSPGWSGAPSIMLSITGIRASALVIWKVRTIPRRAIAYGGRPQDLAPAERGRCPRRDGRSR